MLLLDFSKPHLTAMCLLGSFMFVKINSYGRILLIHCVNKRQESLERKKYTKEEEKNDSSMPNSIFAKESEQKLFFTYAPERLDALPCAFSFFWFLRQTT